LPNFNQGFSHIGKQFQIFQQPGVLAPFAVDHAITIEKDGLVHHSDTQGTLESADVEDQVRMQGPREKDAVDSTVEMRIVRHVVATLPVHVPAVEQIQYAEHECGDRERDQEEVDRCCGQYE